MSKNNYQQPPPTKTWGVILLILFLALYGAALTAIVIHAPAPQAGKEPCPDLTTKLEQIEDKLDLVQAWVCEPEKNSGRLLELETRQTEDSELLKRLETDLAAVKRLQATKCQKGGRK